MAVYTKKASAEWKAAFAKFEKISGFEIQFQDEIDSGELTPEQCWSDNIRWLENLLSDCTNITTPKM